VTFAPPVDLGPGGATRSSGDAHRAAGLPGARHREGSVAGDGRAAPLLLS